MHNVAVSSGRIENSTIKISLFLFGCDKLLEEKQCTLSHSLQGRSKSHSPASLANSFTATKVLIFPLLFHYKPILRRLVCKPEEMEKCFYMPTILMLFIYSEYQRFLSTLFVEYMIDKREGLNLARYILQSRKS